MENRNRVRDGAANHATEGEGDEEMVSLVANDKLQQNLTTVNSSVWRNLWSAKNASLFSLVLQQSGLVLMIRYSRTAVGPEHIPYIPSVVVVSAEILKFMLNGSLEVAFNPDGRINSTEILKTMWSNMISMESIKLFVPALLYLIQNNLLFVALKNLSVPVYQVLNQGKLFTTAFFSRLLLDKKISYCQYFSLLMLAMGVVIVQQSTNKDQNSSMNEGNPWIGFLAVLFSCITSGFAAVYFEKVLKQKTDTKKQLSVYIRNMQLAFWSIGLGTFPILMTEDWNLVKQNGLFQGFTWIVLTIIVFQAITGLLVGFVMKYADSVLKGFATSVAVVLATILSIVFFNDSVNRIFIVGASLVILAVRTYTNNPQVDVPSAGGTAGAGAVAGISQQLFSNRKMIFRIGILAVITVAAMYFNDGSFDTVIYADEKLHMDGFLTQQGDSLPKCPQRDLSPFTIKRIGKQYFDQVPKTVEGSNCLLFDCNQDVAECDNENETNYNGEKPPCCTHVLRDMTRIFDEELCALGIDYHVAFGTLLGLRRADRFIPWSADTDIMLHSEEAMNALAMLWDSQKTGMSHHYSLINRMCITPEFAGGGLKKWAYDEERYRQAIDGWDNKWNLGFPYLDLYVFRVSKDGNMLQWSRCRHYYKDTYPTERKPVYGGQFALNFPPNPDQILRTNYGNEWRFPPAEKEKHGVKIPCPYGPDQK
jgi:UDP-sugar transporter A1/2/3